jgi:hypothetical protein
LLSNKKDNNRDANIFTLAARGLEEPRNSQELLTESVDLTNFVGPLPFSV